MKKIPRVFIRMVKAFLRHNTESSERKGLGGFLEGFFADGTVDSSEILHRFKSDFLEGFLPSTVSYFFSWLKNDFETEDMFFSKHEKATGSQTLNPQRVKFLNLPMFRTRWRSGTQISRVFFQQKTLPQATRKGRVTLRNFQHPGWLHEVFVELTCLTIKPIKMSRVSTRGRIGRITSANFRKYSCKIAPSWSLTSVKLQIAFIRNGFDGIVDLLAQILPTARCFFWGGKKNTKSSESYLEMIRTGIDRPDHGTTSHTQSINWPPIRSWTLKIGFLLAKCAKKNNCDGDFWVGNPPFQVRLLEKL